MKLLITSCLFSIWAFLSGDLSENAVAVSENITASTAVEAYDEELVRVETALWDNDKYTMVAMNRKGARVKAKYFAAEDAFGGSVYKRYSDWAAGRNVILVSSGTYMNHLHQPVGLTIDNGKVVNQTLSNEFDGLVIVYATGGIAVTNLDEGNLFIKCSTGDKRLNLRDSWDRAQFIECAKDVDATVFQTHLLVFKNELKIYESAKCKAEPCERERRFLAVCKDEEGNIQHIVVNSPTPSTLYEGTKRAFTFLRDGQDMEEVVFMINLDTGYQDFFQLYNSNGTANNSIKGKKDISIAVNLLAYYYE